MKQDISGIPSLQIRNINGKYFSRAYLYGVSFSVGEILFLHSLFHIPIVERGCKFTVADGTFSETL